MKTSSQQSPQNNSEIDLDYKDDNSDFEKEEEQIERKLNKRQKK